MHDPFEKGIDLAKIKEEFFDKHKSSIQGGSTYHQADVDRIQKDNEWVRAFRKHGFGDLDKTVSLIHDALKWRKDFGANEMINQEGKYPFPEEMLTRGAMFVRDTDINSRPLLHLVIRMHKKGQFTFAEYSKFIAFHLEREYAFSLSRPIVLLLDMHEAGYSNLDMEMAKFVMTCLKNYYPGLIEYILVFQMPFLFNAAWKIIKNLLPAAAVKLVKFVDKQSIREFVNEDQLLVHMGGTDKFKFEYEPAGFLKETLVKRKHIHDAEPSSHRDVILSKDEEISLRMRKIVNSRNQLENTVLKSVVKSTIEYSSSSSSKSHPTHLQHQLVPSKDFVITPHDLIAFNLKESKPASQFLTLRNNQGVPIAYKIKITSPHKFRVKPPVGIVKAQSETNIKINLSKEFYKNFADSTNEKLLVLWLPIEESVITDDLYEFWKQAISKKLEIKEHRVRCVVKRTIQAPVGTTGKPLRPIQEAPTKNQTKPEETARPAANANSSRPTQLPALPTAGQSNSESMEISKKMFKESQQKMDKQSQVQLFLIFFLILLNVYQLIFK